MPLSKVSIIGTKAGVSKQVPHGLPCAFGTKSPASEIKARETPAAWDWQVVLVPTDEVIRDGSSRTVDAVQYQNQAEGAGEEPNGAHQP